MNVTTVVAMIVLAIEGAEALRAVPVPRWGQLTDGVCCAILGVDFFWRLRRSPRRNEFARTYWMDFVSAIPVIGVPAEGVVIFFARGLRLLRLLVLVRRIVLRLDTPMPTAVLGYLAAVAGTIWVLAATGFYLFEHGVNPSVRTWGDALWWSVTTLSTVGYGDQYPVTTAGRIVAGTTMALGVGVLGTFAGTVGALFLDSRHRWLGEREIFRGTLQRAAVEPREILKEALLRGAAGVVLFHTHPSGDPSPSLEDFAFTRRMVEASGVVGIDFVDHLVLGAEGRWSSIRERRPW